MKIKNTRELVLRAQGHARGDHIAQGTYGNVKANGKAEFKGCFIGCWATPHRQRELRSLWRRLRGQYGYIGPIAQAGYTLDDDDLIPLLKREFGICPEFARICEAIFEGIEKHGAAIAFLPAVAKALPEGKNITPRACHRFARAHGIDIHNPVHSMGHLNRDEADADRTAEALLDWLGSL
jgi:hypothetical protein